MALTVISGQWKQFSIFAEANARLNHSLDVQVNSNLPRIRAEAISQQDRGNTANLSANSNRSSQDEGNRSKFELIATAKYGYREQLFQTFPVLFIDNRTHDIA